MTNDQVGGAKSLRSHLTRTELTKVFRNSDSGVEYVGMEVESAALDAETGESVPYDGARGLAAFLESARKEFDGKPVLERGNIVGIYLPANGGKVSLENGGAVEYSSPPFASVTDAVAGTVKALEALGKIARSIGFAIVPGANFPFTDLPRVQWVPNARGEILRKHFDSLGSVSDRGKHVLSMTLSTQVTLDYGTAEDLAEKINVQAMASTIASALFVNSPIVKGQVVGVLSKRMQWWNRIDPVRTGIIPMTIDRTFSVDRFTDWALSVPMIYRKTADGASVPVGRSFASLLEDGFDDGVHPSLEDWMAHLSQIYTQIRLRQTLEMRAVDGPPASAVASVPAFWSGLTYYAPARVATRDLLERFTVADHRSASADIAQRGLAAEMAGQPIRELAQALLRLSQDGLKARVATGEEHPKVIDFLNPLWEILDTGQTFAEQCLLRWRGDLLQSPARYIAAYRV